eukprot:360264-Chlamydomonas_euryale.AAC.5
MGTRFPECTYTHVGSGSNNNNSNNNNRNNNRNNWRSAYSDVLQPAEGCRSSRTDAPNRPARIALHAGGASLAVCRQQLAPTARQPESSLLSAAIAVL